MPVPKSIAAILKDYDLPEKLRAQITHISRASSANSNLRKNLSRQVNGLKELEASLQAIASMTGVLAQIDLSPEGPFPDDTDLSPQQREAWQEFENALADYHSASGFEEQRMAREKLQQAIIRILDKEKENYLESLDAEADPLNYYLRFIEKYRPGNTGS